jgi:hypothetical protein
MRTRRTTFFVAAALLFAGLVVPMGNAQETSVSVKSVSAPN